MTNDSPLAPRSTVPSAGTLIIVAPTGAETAKSDCPRLPTTLAELVETAVACEAAGAALIHLHIRDADHRPSLDRVLLRETVQAVREQTPDAMENLSRASLHAGMAFSNSLLGIVHALAHPIGGYYNANHGSINAVLLPEVIRYDLPVVTEKLPELAWGLGHGGGDKGTAAEVVQEAVESLLEACGAPRSLRSLGVKRKDLPDLAEKALHDACLMTSPRQADAKDLLTILERAY